MRVNLLQNLVNPVKELRALRGFIPKSLVAMRGKKSLQSFAKFVLKSVLQPVSASVNPNFQRSICNAR